MPQPARPTLVLAVLFAALVTLVACAAPASNATPTAAPTPAAAPGPIVPTLDRKSVV